MEAKAATTTIAPFKFIEHHGITLNRLEMVQRQLLPHGWSALWIDGITEFNEGDNPSLTAVKSLYVTQRFFDGHFPGQPICRGTDMAEMCQLAAALFHFCLSPKPWDRGHKKPMPYKIKEVSFRSPAIPGDTLFIRVFHPSYHGSRGFSCSAEITNQEGKKVLTIEEIFGMMV